MAGVLYRSSGVQPGNALTSSRLRERYEKRKGPRVEEILRGVAVRHRGAADRNAMMQRGHNRQLLNKTSGHRMTGDRSRTGPLQQQNVSVGIGCRQRPFLRATAGRDLALFWPCPAITDAAASSPVTDDVARNRRNDPKTRPEVCSCRPLHGSRRNSQSLQRMTTISGRGGRIRRDRPPDLRCRPVQTKNGGYACSKGRGYESGLSWAEGPRFWKASCIGHPASLLSSLFSPPPPTRLGRGPG